MFLLSCRENSIKPVIISDHGKPFFKIKREKEGKERDEKNGADDIRRIWWFSSGIDIYEYNLVVLSPLHQRGPHGCMVAKE